MQAKSETTMVDTAEQATMLETHFGNEQPIVTVSPCASSVKAKPSPFL